MGKLFNLFLNVLVKNRICENNSADNKVISKQWNSTVRMKRRQLSNLNKNEN